MSTTQAHVSATALADLSIGAQSKDAEAKLAAADKHVAELQQQLEEAMHKLKLQSASDLPHSHRLHRITSGRFMFTAVAELLQHLLMLAKAHAYDQTLQAVVVL